ncbi:MULTISPECIES: cell division protein ZipA [Dyella]|uniref:Cell division protein ZipA n=2 Tax=Dyella TaxID=231454 RepID=A0A4R0Z150_9GAMM|nr:MULTISPECIES: cell division protein ZipA [Dyella]TBR39531.1 cell division protein ZipA [Dyella terrae]TCI12886.1 cell division protein ZipA [Dyella soli]
MTPQPVLAFAWNPAVGIPMAIVGLIVLALIWLFGQPKKEQGRRRVVLAPGEERRDPTFGDVDIRGDGEPSFSARDDFQMDFDTKPAQGELDMGLREELERLGQTLAGERQGRPTMSKPSSGAASIIEALRAPPEEFLASQQMPVAPAPIPGAAVEAPKPVPMAAEASSVAMSPAPDAPAPAKPEAPRVPPRSDLGKRPAQMPVERIVTLFVVAREGESFHGTDLIVAAEKAGLEFGDMGIYHRLVDGKREQGPVFSVANMLKPGNFDLSRLEALRSPGLSFFMTLPAPIPALDAWDAMLPTAQRLAELLDGQVLDEERNALGRQRIAHIRDELRGWDRDHEGKEIVFGR